MEFEYAYHENKKIAQLAITLEPRFFSIKDGQYSIVQ